VGIGVRRQGTAPLGTVLAVAPAGLVASDKPFGSFPECGPSDRGLLGGSLRGGLLGVALVKRIRRGLDQTVQVAALLASVGKGTAPDSAPARPSPISWDLPAIV
jgi:hypothetical protein